MGVPIYVEAYGLSFVRESIDESNIDIFSLLKSRLGNLIIVYVNV